MRIIYLIVVLLTSLCSITSAAAAPPKPNIILIFIDDMGYTDLGCYGNTFVETPHIDKLASTGLRFTDAYAAGAVCSPTRCALQSGQNQVRIGITDFISGHWRPYERVITPRPTMALPTDTVTIAETLKHAGYATGYIGKWHLGNAKQFLPSNQGYDFSAVISGPHLPGKFRTPAYPNLKPKPGQYRTDYEADLSIHFIKENKSKPFFLMLSPYAVHIPLAAMSAKVEKYKTKAKQLNRSLPHPVYAAMIEHCDEMVGRIVNALEEQNLTNNTMIIFTSDNGGLYKRYDYQPHADDIVADLKPLKGEKGSLHEGGIRIPLIIKYPPLIKPNSTSAEPTITYDLYPTFAQLAGAPLPKNQTIDGHSLTPLFTNPAAKLNRNAIHWHYPHYHHDRPASAIRERDWKLIQYLDGTNDIELYNIAQDIGETNNLADTKKGRAHDLKQKLITWRQSVLARMPIPNPEYDPKRAPEWWNPHNGKPVPSQSRKRFPPTEKD